MNRILNKKRMIFLVIAFVFFLVFLFFCIGEGEEEKPKAEAEENYEEVLEKRLEEIISSIDGVSDVKVMLSIACGTEYVYAANKEINGETESLEYYSAGDEDALLIKEIMPKVKGAAVICKGGDNSVIMSEIISLVSRVLDISANNVYVGS